MGGEPSIRYCICCRKRAEKKLLLRFVRKDGAVVFDEKHTMPGRGAYVHPRVVCWSRMGDLKIWEKAFREARGALWDESVRVCMETARNFSEDREISDLDGKGKGRRPVRL